MNPYLLLQSLRRAHAVGYDETIEHCRKSLELLDMDYIDLYLVHAPQKIRSIEPRMAGNGILLGARNGKINRRLKL